MTLSAAMELMFERTCLVFISNESQAGDANIIRVAQSCNLCKFDTFNRPILHYGFGIFITVNVISI